MVLNRTYAGIGSRSTPQYILYKMRRTAKWLRKRGFVLRSGGAKGADSAFAEGAKTAAEIFFPDCKTLTKRCKVGQKCTCNIPENAFIIAQQFHPAWTKLNEYVQRLHARNVQILLGKNLDSRVAFVILWSEYEKQRGGTAMSWRIADFFDIPVVSLKDPKAAQKIAAFAEGVAQTSGM